MVIVPFSTTVKSLVDERAFISLPYSLSMEEFAFSRILRLKFSCALFKVSSGDRRAINFNVETFLLIPYRQPAGILIEKWFRVSLYWISLADCEKQLFKAPVSNNA